jgi:hypothetical protein
MYATILNRNFLLQKRRHKFPSKNQRGQTLVEFMLILLVVTSISYFFARIANQGLGKAWLAFAKLIIDDTQVSNNVVLP